MTKQPANGPELDEALAAEARGNAPTSDDAEVVAGDLATEGEVNATGDAAGLRMGRTQPVPSVDDVEERDRHRWELDPASAEDADSRR